MVSEQINATSKGKSLVPIYELLQEQFWQKRKNRRTDRLIEIIVTTRFAITKHFAIQFQTTLLLRNGFGAYNCTQFWYVSVCFAINLSETVW